MLEKCKKLENRFLVFTYFDVRVHLENGKETKTVEGGFMLQRKNIFIFPPKRLIKIILENIEVFTHLKARLLLFVWL